MALRTLLKRLRLQRRHYLLLIRDGVSELAPMPQSHIKRHLVLGLLHPLAVLLHKRVALASQSRPLIELCRRLALLCGSLGLVREQEVIIAQFEVWL